MRKQEIINPFADIFGIKFHIKKRNERILSEHARLSAILISHASRLRRRQNRLA
jgi:hypothetical protein